MPINIREIDYTGSEEFKKKLLYTQVTRASKVLTLAF